MRVKGNRVLVKRLDEPALKSSIIEVITTDKEPGHYAIVVNYGPGRRTLFGHMIPIDVKVGDLVILAKYSGAPVTLKGADGSYEEFHLVDADDVLAVVEKAPTIPTVK